MSNFFLIIAIFLRFLLFLSFGGDGAGPNLKSRPLFICLLQTKGQYHNFTTKLFKTYKQQQETSIHCENNSKKRSIHCSLNLIPFIILT